jgi:hypothetical protein
MFHVLHEGLTVALFYREDMAGNVMPFQNHVRVIENREVKDVCPTVGHVLRH